MKLCAYASKQQALTPLAEVVIAKIGKNPPAALLGILDETVCLNVRRPQMLSGADRVGGGSRLTPTAFPGTGDANTQEN